LKNQTTITIVKCVSVCYLIFPQLLLTQFRAQTKGNYFNYANAAYKNRNKTETQSQWRRQATNPNQTKPNQTNQTKPNRSKSKPTKANQIIRLDGATHEGCEIWVQGAGLVVVGSAGGEWWQQRPFGSV